MKSLVAAALFAAALSPAAALSDTHPFVNRIIVQQALQQQMQTQLQAQQTQLQTQQDAARANVQTQLLKESAQAQYLLLQQQLLLQQLRLRGAQASSHSHKAERHS